ncbi:TetR/AcrR family transcriptional regulator [Cucumibacter marinus]|uniref:TetR/AcrR family transcriptional regulator n=1 Tax=Cucumibacter marinus TaxID=1121252 RepID=UPI00040F6D2A|nr:TetR/AcrR family transcriptional regulator [Cucumibacter marinus]
MAASGSATEQKQRIPNATRTERTRTALVSAARELFAAKGFAETGTPEIVKAARVTRGALYHHFEGKTALFRAVIEAEAEAVARAIETRTTEPASARDALIDGANAFFDAMSVSGRARLLLIDGPATLGHEEMNRIDRATGGAELIEGLAYARDHGELRDLPIEPLADLLSAAFDRAALAIDAGEDAEAYRTAIARMIDALLERH